jgi:serine/threonine protein kinase/Tol biopolymer transport system component
VPALERPPRLARFENFELDLRARELRLHGGEAIRLGEQPLQILIALLESPGGVVLREELRKRLWPNDTIVEFEHSISAAMNRLRQALRDSADEPRFIETLPRRGYRWLVPVEWVEAGQKKPVTTSTGGAEKHGIRQGLIGKRVSHYRVLEVLGGGGMGLVYKAEDLKLGRCVALKFLGEELIGDHRALERFEHEARAISALDHPNICAIYEVEEHEGQPFLIMQLLQGQTLRQRIESADPGEPAFTQTELLDFGIQIVEGLEAAHQKGILHRDVKPANIFITNRGEIKLLDFGLAKLIDTGGVHSEAARTQAEARPSTVNVTVTSQTSMTLTGAMMGTASYMSPEQVRKEKLDARSDLFSFGVVLYEMATGHQPFRGDDLQAIHDAVLHSEPPSPRAWNSNLPAGLELIIGKALAKDREKRYQSAAEIISELKRVRQLATLERAMPPRRRGWTKLATVGTAGLVVLTAAGFVGRKWTAERRAQPPRMEIARLTDSGRAEEVAISPDGRYVAYAQREVKGVALRVREMTSGSDIQVLPPEAIGFIGLTFSPDGNHLYFVRPDDNDPGFKYLYVMPTLGGKARRLVTDIDTPVSFSPDGRQFVYSRGIPTEYTAEVRIANADGSANRMLAKMADAFPGGAVGAATWSPDGRTIAVSFFRFRRKPRYMLYTMDVSDGKSHDLYSSPHPIGRAMWLPRGDSLLAALDDREGRGQLWTIGFPQGSVDRVTNDLTNYWGNIDLTRNATTLAAIESHALSNIWSMPGMVASKAVQVTSLSTPIYQVRELPNGNLLANGGKVWMIDAEGKQRTEFADLSNVGDLAVCGNYVVLTSEVNSRSELLRLDLDGSNPVKLASGEFGSLSCSHDGRFLFYTEGGPPQTIYRISVAGGTPVEISTVLGEDAITNVSLSPDGNALLYAYEDFKTLKVKLAIVAVTGGPPVRTMDAPGELYQSSLLRWSQTGKSVEYLLTKNGASNIWEQPLEGGEPRQLTNFGSGRIFEFSWSKDGEHLLLCRGEVTTDVVLLSHLH